MTLPGIAILIPETIRLIAQPGSSKAPLPVRDNDARQLSKLLLLACLRADFCGPVYRGATGSECMAALSVGNIVFMKECQLARLTIVAACVPSVNPWKSEQDASTVRHSS
jgi:hypothetical protein